VPKSQIVAKIPNRCQNPKSLPKSQIVAEVQIAAKILLNLGFQQQFRILATVWISAMIWNFGNSLGFRQQFGISATVWDFGNSLGFWQQFGILATVWDFGNSLGFQQQFGILAIVWDLEFQQLTYAERGLGFGI
jgi:hypothetical protein